MKIYFSCSTAELAEYRDSYYAIRDYLAKEHILTRDWLEETEKHMQAGNTELPNIKNIYKACVEAIREAELVVIEDTVSNFSTGHQITLALQIRKPTLVLWQRKKHKHFNQMFIHGIESDLLQVAEYTPDTLVDVLQTFINTYADGAEKNRFHLVLSGRERRYLDWAQFVKHKSRTKVIREALKNIIEHDHEYQAYLQHKHPDQEQSNKPARVRKV
ncbi:MAG TPA: hypothetical protein VLG16_02480 [Candidatus Saccharimonadales bacterium]|nr:hypothetical protein [Candidatus Saccharimonadales bacterium]